MMTETKTLSLAEIEDISFRALVAAGTSEANARPLAVATAATVPAMNQPSLGAKKRLNRRNSPPLAGGDSVEVIEAD